ncbi:MAG TPA: 3-oxoacyl-ACP synthase [Aggregatilineaceae bacterium]|nr:3-oxoacyl-ACP synthase [Aggregatilineaceae bacterium]
MPSVDFPPIGIAGTGLYIPSSVVTGAEIAARTGLPEFVVSDKMGIREIHTAGPQDTITAMASQAAQKALDQAGLSPLEIDAVVYHGSEYKDHIVWSAASKIQHLVGASNAYAFEMYALCAGAPIAYKAVRDMMRVDERLKNVLLVSASRENDLIDFTNARTRFMFNFGAGGSAVIFQRGLDRNWVLESAIKTDGTLADTVIMTPAAAEIALLPAEMGTLHGRLDVHNADYMAERLGQVSLGRIVEVITEAIRYSGHDLSDLRFLGITHMKRSFYEEILAAVGLTPDQSVYLDHFGHIQSVDQILALELGLQAHKIRPGDLIVLAGAGTGYTWSATAFRWG